MLRLRGCLAGLLALAAAAETFSTLASPRQPQRVVLFLGLEGSGQALWHEALCSSRSGCEDASEGGSVGDKLRQLFAAPDAATFNQLRADAVLGLAAYATAAAHAGPAARVVLLNLPRPASASGAAHQAYSRVNPLGRPDPVLLAALCAEAHVDLRLVVLVRHPPLLLAALAHAHSSAGSGSNSGSTGPRSSESSDSSSSRRSSNGIIPRPVGAYELRVMSDQLACLQAQLLLLAAGEAGLRESLRGGSAATAGAAGSGGTGAATAADAVGDWAATGGAAWWQERVRFPSRLNLAVYTPFHHVNLPRKSMNRNPRCASWTRIG
jgi:hypothetical protein